MSLYESEMTSIINYIEKHRKNRKFCHSLVQILVIRQQNEIENNRNAQVIYRYMKYVYIREIPHYENYRKFQADK